MKRTKRTIAPIGGPVRIASSCASCVKSENEKMKKIEEMKMKKMNLLKFRVTGALVGTTYHLVQQMTHQSDMYS